MPSLPSPEQRADVDVTDALKRALAMHQGGDVEGARAAYHALLESDPEQPDALHYLGLLECQQGDFARGRPLLLAAARVMPNQPAHCDNAIKVLRRVKDLRKRAAALQALVPFNNLVIALYDELAAVHGRLRAAEDVQVHVNLGISATLRRQALEAVGHFQIVVAAQPDNPQALFNLASAEQDAGQLNAALAHFDACIALKANHYSAIWNRAQTRLMLGDYAGGWRDWLLRWESKSLAGEKRDLVGRAWQGERSDGAILVYTEQGSGDVIQFLRFLPELIARVAQVYVECQPFQRRLIEQIPGLAGTLPRPLATPPVPVSSGPVSSAGGTGAAFGWHVRLLDLASIFGTRLDSIPPTPYLPARPSTQASLPVPDAKRGLPKHRLPRVGLVWQGNAKHPDDVERSIDFAGIGEWLEIDGICFYSLHNEPPACLHGRDDIIDLSPQIDDLLDTAGLIGQLDLVISVDTAVAHLAGAVGAPCWMLVRQFADWRWLIDRSDSPWYPTARIFRKSSRDDWRREIETVKDALIAWRDARREAT